MNVILAFALVALGMIIHAAHAFICKNAATIAWKRGYEQRSIEDSIRRTAEENAVKRGIEMGSNIKPLPPSSHSFPDGKAFFGMMASNQTRPQMRTPSMQPPQPLPDAFGQQFRQNGRAVSVRTGGSWHV